MTDNPYTSPQETLGLGTGSRPPKSGHPGKLIIGILLLFAGVLSSGVYLLECFLGDGNCFLELLLFTVPMAWLGVRTLRGKHVLIVGVLAATMSVLAFMASNPHLGRFRRMEKNESIAAADMHTLMEAEERYAESNGGYYDRLECLVTPADCLLSYSPEEPAFLREAVDGTKHGYMREFIPGELVDADGVSDSSIQSWAFVAEPELITVTGLRSICGDSTGVIRVAANGETMIVDGLCNPVLPVLE